MIQPISATELKTKLATDKNCILLDVRDHHEYDAGHITNCFHIPLSELAHRYHELDTNVPVVLYCHFGKRSLMAAHLLQQAGFTELYNLTGGIDAWSCEVDPSLPRY